MRAASHFQSVGKLLYTQNPFYLISCGLILYGIHLAGPENMPLESRSWILAGAMAGYTLLMAVTAIAVIRIGKVWQDARSILLIVIIGLLGLSVSFDQLCISNWKLALALLGGCAVFAVGVSELIFHTCHIRFGSLYRIPFYAILLAFFVVPVVAGHAIENEYHILKNWMAVIFSFAVAGGLILLAPAIRRGTSYVSGNGTPWQWPLFPLSAFVVLIVLAAIRSHAIWMSFSTLSGPIALEPFLLMPFGFAIAYLFIEHFRQSDELPNAYAVMIILPVLAFAGLANSGLTRLPIGENLQLVFGSAIGMIVVLLSLFYALMWMRGLTKAGYFLAFTLFVAAVEVPVPGSVWGLGAESWMIAAIASALLLGICIVNRKSDWSWLWAAIFASATIVMAAGEHNLERILYPAAGTVLLLTAMTIGACFHTELARLLRACAGVVVLIAAMGLAIWQAVNFQFPTAIALLSIAILPCIYLLIVRRRGWMWIAGHNIAWCAISLAVVSRQLWQSVIEQRTQLAIPTGVACFAIAVIITSAKTGALDQALRKARRAFRSRRLQVGL